MQLTIFSGSPKADAGNTAALIGCLAEGFLENHENRCAVHTLRQDNDLEKSVAAYPQAEYVIIAFPLRFQSMPSAVKKFIERLGPFSHTGAEGKIGFLVQFGFKQAIYARPLERYLEKLAGLLHRTYLGTIIKGGCNDMASRPTAHRKARAACREIGRRLGRTGLLDPSLLRRFARPERIRFLPRFLLILAAAIYNRFYVDARLKKLGIN